MARPNSSYRAARRNFVLRLPPRSIWRGCPCPDQREVRLGLIKRWVNGTRRFTKTIDYLVALWKVNDHGRWEQPEVAVARREATQAKRDAKALAKPASVGTD